MFIRPWLEALKSRWMPGKRRTPKRFTQSPLPSQVEGLEEKIVLSAFDLVTVIPNQGVFLTDGTTMSEAPREVTLRFSPGQTINAGSLGAISVVRAGLDGNFGTTDDVSVGLGYVGAGDNPNEVIVRFASTLPDDKYQIRIQATGGNAIVGNPGDSLTPDPNKTYKSFNFELDLGAQVDAVVPQPVIRSQVFSTVQYGNLTDGDVVTVTAGPNTYKFEINLLPNNVVTPGNVQVDITAGATATQIADALVAAINTAAAGQLTASNSGSNTITVAGTNFEPVVTFATTRFDAFARSFLTIADATKLSDGDLVRVSLTNPVTSVTTTYTFEMNKLPNNIVAGGNIRVNFNAGDSAATIAAALRTAINGLAINNPTSQLNAVVVGNSIAITSASALGTPAVAVTTAQAGAFSQVTGTLAQLTNKVVVYFNQDQLDSTIAQNPAYYRVINSVTKDVLLPQSVSYQYNAQTGLSVAVLTFASNLPNATYNLKIGVSSESNNTIQNAVKVGTIFSNQDFVINEYLGDGANSLVSNDANDVDLYEFTKIGAGTVTLTLVSSSGLDGVLTLLDSTGTPIGAPVNLTGAGGTEVLTSGVLGTGKFYARITSASGTGGYQLTIHSAEISGTSDNNSSFSDPSSPATDLGTLGTGGITVDAQIESQGAYVIMPQLPGGSDEPGHRDLPEGPFPGSPEVGHGTGTTADPAPPIATQERTYSFPLNYGAGLSNQISPEQRAMARQILQIYANYSGIQFREVARTAPSDIQIVTGDVRAVDPTLDPLAVGGIASGGYGYGIAIMNAGTIINSSGATQASDATYGGSWFGTAVHEIGHLLGLGHSYDVPSTQGAGLTGEPVFPGDNDIIHLLRIFPDNSSDIDLYKFNITQAGKLSAQTIAERLVSPSLLDSQITLYKEVAGVRTIVARNDDFYSKDAGLEIALDVGTYYIGVTSTGNDNFDPTIPNSGNGGTSQGAYQLKLDFQPNSPATSGLRDATGRVLDGDHDGKAGGEYNSWFVVAPTVFVDKLAPAGGSGTINAPFNTIGGALAAVGSGSIVRIVGNGGADGDASTVADNVPYAIGRDYNVSQTPLADGATFQVPAGVTVMIDAGSLIKVRGQTIDVGTSSSGVDRSHGALQVLGTPVNNVTFTSWRDDAKGSIDDGTNGSATGADWGGIVFRQDSDSAIAGAYVNLVNHSTLQYGGGQVSVDGGQLRVYNVIDLETSRPTITNNIIKNNADAAISANPDSFKADDGRIGPDIHGNIVTQNSTNGLFIRIQTSLGAAAETLNVIARFDDTDITHVITQNLILNGHPAGELGGTVSGRLMIDPGTIVKLSGARIETGLGSSNLIAEGTAENPIRFTSQQDDKYGAGGTFDLKNDGKTTTSAGTWSGFFLQPTSTASFDHVSITYAGGSSEIGGNTDYFNPIEVLQGKLRVTNSVFENNLGGASTTNRAGRGFNDASVIFVRGAQPIIVSNVFRNNSGNVVSINANSLQSTVMPDYGRSTGPIDRKMAFDDNYGPLIRLNSYQNNSTNGMNIRPEELTIESVWDDTDIAHVVRGTITSGEFHTYGGLRLLSSATGSLVVKLEGSTAGFVATGDPLEIADRVGGTVQIIGQPGYPVILTSLKDDTVSTGFLPNGFPLFDTNNDGTATVAAPGDWNSISFDQYSNDRNVSIVIESEPALTQGNDINATVGNPQPLGNLAPNENSGDENRRLGFEVHGFISPDSPSDIDVYSFTANAGTEVWIDLDQTSDKLDAMVELVNANGVVLARSLNSQDETNGLYPLSGTLYNTVNGLPGGPGNSDLNTLTKDPNLGGDFYTTNFHDAGFRVVLPGTAGTTNTYFVRVRSQPATNPTVIPGTADPAYKTLTSGAYQLQVRLRQQDEQPGSTVRYADIRYATNGIELHGLPAHSPLMSEAGETTNDNNTPSGAQSLGPLLQTDRNTISVAGSLSSKTDVDFYKFTVDYSQVQVIAGASDGGKFFPTVFDIDWADGLTRPDTSIAVYNSSGQLIYVGRASDLSDDQPAPGQGQDLDDFTRGSLGILDPFIGTVNLPAGVNGTSETGGTNPNPPNATLTTYYVAVYSNGMTPTSLTANFNNGASTANQLVRLEPVNSIRRVVEDHIGFTGYDSQDSHVAPISGPMIDIRTAQSLSTSVRAFTLADVNLFVTTSTSLFIYDPYYGRREVDYVDYTGDMRFQDIDMRSDGRLFGVRRNAAGGANESAYVELDPATGQELGAATALGIAVPDPATNPPLEQSNAASTSTALAIHRADVGNYDYIYFAVPDADLATPATNVSKLYRATAGGVATFAKNSTGAVGLIRDSGGVITTQTTGMQYNTAGSVLYGVSSGGQFYSIVDGKSPNTDNGNGIDTALAYNVFDLSSTLSSIGATGFSGLTTAPQNVTGGFYKDFMFAITSNGRIVAIDPSTGTLQTIFDNDNNSATGVGGAESNYLQLKDQNGNNLSVSATGLAFSPVDFNLWHPTTTRGGGGHGVTSTGNVDNSRDPFAEDINMTGGNWTLVSQEAYGGASMYFGIEPYTDGLTYYSYQNQAQYGVLTSTAQRDLTATSNNIRNNYNAPGGAAGSLVTNSFSLEGYSANDEPVLYFNYWLDTAKDQGNNGFDLMSDSARVYVSTDDGQSWHLVATNNSTLSSDNTADAELPAYLSTNSNASGKSNQGVQELFDVSSSTDPWRQARIDLRNFVGSSTIKLRFDFSTSGRSGTVLDSNGVRVASNDTGNPTYQGVQGDQYGVPNFSNNTALRAADNAHEGFYIDDIIVGFAGRGEMVTNAPVDTSFLNLATKTNTLDRPTFDPDPASTPQLLSGQYQLSIRRGEDYGMLPDTAKKDVLITPTLDINDRLSTGQTILVGNAIADGDKVTIYDGLVTRTFEFDTNNNWVNGNIRVNIAGLDPVLDKGYIASALAAQITASFADRNSSVIAKAVGAAVNSDRVDLFGAVQVDAVGSALPTVFDQQVESNDTLLTATDTTITTTSNGTYTGSGIIGNGPNAAVDVDMFKMVLAAGQTVLVDLDLPNGTGYSGMRIFDSNGIQVAANTSFGAGPSPEYSVYESYLSYTPLIAGTYYVGVSAYFNFAYNPTVAGSGSNVFDPTPFAYNLNISTGNTTVPVVPMSVDRYTRRGDDNLVRQQGQFIIENNTIRNVDGDGILIDDNRRINGLPHPGAVANTPVNNTANLVTGIYIQNNVIAKFGANGINVNGDTDTTGGPAATPFVKIVNNTLYGPDAVVAGSAQADVVILIDVSTSMGSAINTLKNRLLQFDSQMQAANIDARYGLVLFPQNSTTAPIQRQDFTDFTTFTQTGSAFDTITLTGGTENGSQAVLEALNDFNPATTFNFRPGSRPVVLILTDEDDDSSANEYTQALGDLTANNALFFAIADPSFGNTTARYGTMATTTGGGLFSIQSFLNNTGPFFTTFTAAVVGAIGAGPTGVGINIANNATATIMNNVIANTTTGISVDSTSSAVVDANLYQGNVSDGVLGNNALYGTDTAGIPLFVDPVNNNFYPAPGSPLIDSSRSTFNDRDDYIKVTGPLGIPKSPIIAPIFDRYGQLRVDDSNQPGPSNQPGLGNNPFQDRGAIERADFEGGIVIPASPQDNDGAGVDYDPTSSTMWIDAANPSAPFTILTQFKLQLVDNGIGIDDSTVDRGDFLLLKNGTALVEGQDYFFTYNQNTNEAIFTSVSTFALDSRYQIVMDATGISDFAGNYLQNNQANPITPTNTNIPAPFDSSLLYFTYVITDGKNDAPVNSFNGAPLPAAPVPGAAVTIDEDTSITFSTANGNAITISDQDAYLDVDGDPTTGVNGGRIRVTISIPSGFGTLSLASGATDSLELRGGGVDYLGLPVYQITLDGRIDDINAALNGLTYTPPLDYPIGLPKATVNLTIFAEDLGKFGPPSPGTTDPKSTTSIVPIDINPVNDTPTLTISSATTINILEDTVTPTQIDLTGITAGGGENQSLQVTVSKVNPASPLIPIGNITVNYPNALLPAVQPTTGNIQFTAAANRSGTEVLRITVTDAGLDGVFGTADDKSTFQDVTVNVTAVNDAPTVSLVGPSVLTINEDESVLSNLTVNLNNISVGAFEFPGQILTLTATSSDPSIIPNPTITYVQGSSTAILTFAPVADRYGGPVTITINAVDNGGVSNGGVDAATPITFTVNVLPINDPPTVTVPSTLTIREDDITNPQIVFLTGITPGPFESSQNISNISVTSNNQSVIPNANIVQGPLTNGTVQLTITPLPNQSGTVVITVVITDDAGGNDTVTKQFTINVLSVNDAPSFNVQPPLSPLNINEDAGQQTITLDTFSAGPANESGQTLILSAVSLNPTLISDPIVSSITAGQATVKYTPVANAFGQATIRITLRDNGGTANGGVDTYTQDIIVNIAPLNDAPTLNPIAPQPLSGLLLEDAGQQTVNLSGITAGPANESAQVVTITAAITSGNPNLVGNFIASPVSVNGTATLKYTPNANEFGTATVTVTVTDNGPNGGGNVNFTTQTFTITITPVNDQPTFDVIQNQIVNEDAGQQIIPLTNISAGAANESSQTLQFSVFSDNINLIPNDLAHLSVVYTQGNPTGQLVYTTLPNTYGVANITVTLRDNGGLTNGGNDTLVRTFRITVNSVPDVPSDITLTGNQVYENQPVGTVVGSLSTTDADLPADQFTYQVIGGTGLGFFQAVGNQLRTSQVLDFESAPSGYTVQIRVTDNFGLFFDKTFNVQVLNLNDAPTLDVLPPVVMNEDPISPVLVTLTGVSAGAGESQLITITAVSDNPGLFANPVPVVYTSPNGTATLSLSPLPNAIGTATITVTVRDNGGTANGGVDQVVRTFLVTVNPVNDPPSDILLSNDTIQEIPAGTTLPAHVLVGQLSSVDPDNPAAGNTFTYTLVSGAGSNDNAKFSIVGNQLYAEGPIDFDTQPNYSIRVRSTDNGSPVEFFEKILTIHSTNKNEPATGISTSNNPISGIPNSIPENQPQNSVVGNLIAADPDANEITTFALVSGTGSTDNALFRIVNNQLIARVTFDYETKNSYTVRIRATDSQGLVFETPVVISVTNVNEVATNINLSNSSVVENSPATTVVGSFTTVDPDSGDTFTYSLVSGAGSTDNAKFEIVGNQLRVVVPPNYEDPSHAYSIRVRSVDNGNLGFEKVFSITILNVNEAPTALEMTSTSVNENQPIGTVVGNFVTTDEDVPEAFTYALVSGVGDTDNSLFEIAGNSLKTKVKFDYEAQSTYTIRVRSTDSGSHSIESFFTITINDTKDGPKITLNSQSTTTKGSKAVVVDPTATIEDFDSPNFNNGQLKVTIQSGEQTGDTLSIDTKALGTFQGQKLTYVKGRQVIRLGKVDIASVVGGVRGQPLKIQFGNNTSKELFQQVMRAVNFKGKPYAAPRVISMQAFDELGIEGNSPTRNITVVK